MTTSKTAQPIAEKEDFRISYRQDRFLAWPFLGRAYCFDGTELVVSFYSSPCRYERLMDIRHTQVLENSTVITARSLDGGQTWPDDQQTELFDLRSTYSELEAGRRLDVDMRQPDSILFSYSAYNWEGKKDFVPPKVEQAPTLFHRCIVIRSPDRGRAWETRPTWIDRLNNSEMRTFSNFLRRSDGVILLPASTGGAIEEHECVLFSSHDGGESWAFYSRIVGPTGPEGFDVHQPFLIELPNGNLLATIRHQGASVAWTLLVESDDGGRTWSVPRRINDYGAPASLVLMPDGRVVVVYGYRRPGFGIPGRVSEDGGKSWSGEFVLQDKGGSRDLGYPSACSMDDGRIFVAYYFNEQGADVDLHGGRRHIRGCIFRLG